MVIQMQTERIFSVNVKIDANVDADVNAEPLFNSEQESVPTEFSSPQSNYEILSNPTRNNYEYWSDVCTGQQLHLSIILTYAHFSV